MSFEFMKDKQVSNPQVNSGHHVAPPGKKTGADAPEPLEAIPPRGLIPRRWHISLWLGVALFLGAIIAYFLLDYVVE